MGKPWKQCQTLFFWAPKSLQMVIAAMKFKALTPWKGSYDQPRQHIKKQRHYFANESPSSLGYGFSSSHVWMWELDYKETWAPKNDAFELWCWRRLLRVSWTVGRSNQSRRRTGEERDHSLCHGGRRVKVTICRPGRKLSPEAECAGALTLHFLATKSWKVRCLSHLVCCILLKQSAQKKTRRKQKRS